MEAQNQKLSQLLECKFLVNAITQAVAGNLNIIQGNKPTGWNGGSGHIGEAYLVKPQSP